MSGTEGGSVPYGHGVSTLRPAPAAASVALVREVLAVVLILVGLVGLVTAGFLWCLPAGLATLSTVVAGAGVALGYQR